MVAVTSTDDDTIFVRADPSKFDRVPVRLPASKFDNLLPSPANPVAVKIPALESKVNLVLVFTACDPVGLTENNKLQVESTVSSAKSTSEADPVSAPTNDVYVAVVPDSVVMVLTPVEFISPV